MGPYALGRGGPPWDEAPKTLVCPSAGNENLAYAVNYCFSVGDTIDNNRDATTVRGLFGSRDGVRMAEITDGTSNTIAMSEHLITNFNMGGGRIPPGSGRGRQQASADWRPTLSNAWPPPMETSTSIHRSSKDELDGDGRTGRSRRSVSPPFFLPTPPLASTAAIRTVTAQPRSCRRTVTIPVA